MTTWHHDRDGYGTVLGERNDVGYPVLTQGVKWEQALIEFPGITKADEIPVVVEAVPSHVLNVNLNVDPGACPTGVCRDCSEPLEYDGDNWNHMDTGFSDCAPE